VRLATALPRLALAACAGLAMPAHAVEDAWTLLPPIDPANPPSARDVPMHPAPGGFALTVRDGQWHLVPADIVGSFVAFNGKGSVALEATPADALLYLHVPGLAVGKVDTPDMRFKGVSRVLASPALTIAFKGTVWRLGTKDERLALWSGARQQTLGDATDDEAMRQSYLAWAGDLDRDGQLDVIIKTTREGAPTWCLWLSSRAVAPEVVGKAGCIAESL
jgi:hypothetical protein